MFRVLGFFLTGLSPSAGMSLRLGLGFRVLGFRGSLEDASRGASGSEIGNRFGVHGLEWGL